MKVKSESTLFDILYGPRRTKGGGSLAFEERDRYPKGISRRALVGDESRAAPVAEGAAAAAAATTYNSISRNRRGPEGSEG